MSKEQGVQRLLDGNRAWAQQCLSESPEYFHDLASGQHPEYLWIGCSDSRVSADEITGTRPGEIFVHRNVANLVVHRDINVMAVLQYAVELLEIQHVIVCGHYGCSGIEAAWKKTPLGLIDNWLRHVQDVAERHADAFGRGMSEVQATERLAELNVLAQTANVCRTTIVMDAWRRGQSLTVHGWIYRLQDGLLRDLGLSVARDGVLAAEHARAVGALGCRV